MKSVLPILTVLMALVVLWYGATVLLNAQWTRDQAARAGVEVGFSEILRDTLSQTRPKLPAPHQVVAELWQSTWMEEVYGRRGIVQSGTLSNRSLIYHGWVTLSATMLGFAFGTGLGILLAVGIVHSKAMDLSVMPWAIASQTVPILAIAPMVIVVLASIGIKGLIPKAIIAAYLSFFPVLVGMVKGFRAPDAMQLDLLKTYNASRVGTFWRLRLPSSVPYLFASLKVGIAAALVGTIVGELPAGASAGLGARLLSGSYYGQTIQIWAALLAAATLAAGLVMIVGAVERVVLGRMGMRA
ncbi:ABC transporter permease [Phaeovulum sp.]|jgi:NitT/TauT family transport system permease protein|uniref:ABC transporter permease n=1 Tax=Phaeovulum sp. TaxID=2934796 RepID=UPI00272FF451|nr:ABC transporter permease [Phaeovulum sp.]MDP1670146.1 ABC transporter permease [Phaeovulum sp.]MDP2064208.1 ABC transporter permease [Phaeovulum sp.]MDP3861992.1 ABC transporter permease [Phaeovulum sp.]MDZ4120358.1 ABC transporter permease [Phaeovulum sp.]